MAINSTDALMAKLFKWTTKIEYNGIVFYQRIVGDAVIDDARQEALLEASKMRRNLRNPDSTEYLIYLDVLEDLEDSEIRDNITGAAIRDTMREYIQSTPRPTLPALADHPSQEEQEEYELEKQRREDDYLANLTEYAEAWRKDFEKTLEGKDRAALVNLAKKYRTDQACEQRFTEVFEATVVCASIYTDDKYKTRMFTVDQYQELPSELKLLLRNSYNNINIDPDSLKN